jgi:hypothetical protein
MATMWRMLVLVFCFVSVCVATAAPRSAGYHLVKNVRFRGTDSWDYSGVDPATHRIFLPRHGRTMVLDAKGNVVGNMPNTGHSHAVAFAPALHLGFLSNGPTGTITFFDLATLKIIRTVQIPHHSPDDLIYDPFTKRVFVFNFPSYGVPMPSGGAKSAKAEGNDVTAVDAVTGRVVGSLQLDGKLEGGQTDGAGHIFVEVEPKSEIVEFNARNLAVLARWPTAPCKEPGGQLAIDVAHHRLFVGCENRMMAVMNTETGKVVATVPIGPEEDATKFDPGTDLAFAGGSDGTITVVHEDSPDKFTVVQTLRTDPGAFGTERLTVDTNNHNLYCFTGKMGPAPPKTPQNPEPRPTILPNTATLWIFSR